MPPVPLAREPHALDLYSAAARPSFHRQVGSLSLREACLADPALLYLPPPPHPLLILSGFCLALTTIRNPSADTPLVPTNWLTRLVTLPEGSDYEVSRDGSDGSLVKEGELHQSGTRLYNQLGNLYRVLQPSQFGGPDTQSPRGEVRGCRRRQRSLTQGDSVTGALSIQRERERRRQDSGHSLRSRGQWSLTPEEATQRGHVDRREEI